MSEKHNRDVIIGHTSDGIQEYDNPMPMWWLGILWFTIAFSLVFAPYLAMTEWTQEGQYDAEVAAADAKYGAALAAQKAEAEKKLEALAAKGGGSDADVAAGADIYKVNCVACHAADGTGGIGPDLTDAEWIHGGSYAEVTKTVSTGVLEKGMIAWGPILGDEKVAQVSAYVISLSKK
ncbi:MAG: c-type cytochrome [Deltaproteobacteria bacterium]|nr:c-type cytochrome [Deltaproteobacteria bacterium]